MINCSASAVSCGKSLCTYLVTNDVSKLSRQSTITGDARSSLCDIISCNTFKKLGAAPADDNCCRATRAFS